MKHYETVFILNPVLSEDQVRETVEKYKDYVKSKGGRVAHHENWGLKKMAYPIENKKSGFYHLLEFTGPGELISSFEVEMKRDERILRFLTVSLDKFAMDYAQRRRQKGQSTVNA